MTETDPTLLRDLEELVDPATRGDPMSPLKWTSKASGTWQARFASWGIASGMTPSVIC